MSKILVTKRIEGEDKEFEVEVGPNNTVYLCEGESVVDNPDNVNIHYPTNTSHIKTAIAWIVIVGFIVLGAVAFIAQNADK